jgi:ABC-2 type transport system ATP-binding protein
MPQRFSLYTDLTVAENLLFFANIYHVPRSERRQREHELLDFSRLAPFRTRLAGDLSGGMKQKLALACTLIHRPAVLFLDEPTTGVDPVSRRDLWKILYSLLGQGVTLFVTTPYLDEAERCHRVALMDKGRILLCDTPDALKQRMTGDLLELIAQPQRRAKQVLSGLAEVRGLQVFGDRLHVWLADAARDQPQLLEALSQHGIQVIASRRAGPGLEDVFVSLLSEGRVGQEQGPRPATRPARNEQP